MLGKVFPLYANLLVGNQPVEFAYSRSASTASCSIRDDGSKFITLPSVPVVMDEKTFAKNLGLTIHETEHFIDTDFEAYCSKYGDKPLVKELMNVFEDIRIEGGIARRYVGGKDIIDDMAKVLADTGFYSHPKEHENPGNLIVWFILMRMNVDLLRQPLHSYADSWEEAFERSFPSSFKADIRSIMKECSSMISTSDAVKLAEKVYELLLKEQESQEQQSKPKPNGPGFNNSPEDVEKPEPSHDEDDPLLQNIIMALETLESDITNKDKGTAFSTSDSRNSFGSCHVGEVLELFEKRQNLYDFESEARIHSNRLIQQLRSILLSQSGGGAKKSSRSGRRMHRNAYLNALTGNTSQGLYVSQTTGRKVKSDVHLLMDFSGSMSGERIEIASQSAVSMILALDQLNGVYYGVSGFAPMTRKDTGERVNHFNLKTGNAKDTIENLNRLDMFRLGSSTPLGAGMIGALSLMSELFTSDNRLLFVFIDGDCDDFSLYLQAKSQADSLGIKVIGIGIQADVSHLFEHSVMINDVTDLSLQFMNLLRKELSVA